jgi:chemotaxis protein MotD
MVSLHLAPSGAREPVTAHRETARGRDASDFARNLADLPVDAEGMGLESKATGATAGSERSSSPHPKRQDRISAHDAVRTSALRKNAPTKPHDAAPPTEKTQPDEAHASNDTALDEASAETSPSKEAQESASDLKAPQTEDEPTPITVTKQEADAETIQLTSMVAPESPLTSSNDPAASQDQTIESKTLPLTNAVKQNTMSLSQHARASDQKNDATDQTDSSPEQQSDQELSLESAIGHPSKPLNALTASDPRALLQASLTNSAPAEKIESDLTNKNAPSYSDPGTFDAEFQASSLHAERGAIKNASPQPFEDANIETSTFGLTESESGAGIRTSDDIIQTLSADQNSPVLSSPATPLHSAVPTTHAGSLPIILPGRAVYPALPYARVPMEIGLAALEGQRSLHVRLSPADLGTIDIALDVSDQSEARAHISADDPRTLAMLKQDAPFIRQALEQTGLSTHDNSLNFSLRQDGQSSDRQNMNDQHSSSSRKNKHDPSSDIDASAITALPPTPLKRVNSLLDMNI